SVGANDSVVIGRSKPLPQLVRCDPSDAMVEFWFVPLLNVPNVISGMYWKPCIICTAVGENPSVAGLNHCPVLRYSPNRAQLPRGSNSMGLLATRVYPPFSPRLVR